MQAVLSQILQYTSAARGAVSSFADGAAKIIDGMSKVGTTFGGLGTLGSLGLVIVLFIFSKRHVLPRLYKELRGQSSTKTKAELKWIEKKYVMHTLCDAGDASGAKIKAPAVLKEIRRKQDYVVGIVGKAGSGKSEMLLWLYIKLAKSLNRRCAFVQMGAIQFSSIDLIRDSIKRQLDTPKKLVPFCRAYIFIDAIDETHHLFNGQISFDANFINELRRSIDILYCNIIFSVRDECFKRGVADIAERCRTDAPTIYRVLPMNQTQIKSIYKSFRYAKRVEKRLGKRNNFNYRFQAALPDTKVRRSIKMFVNYIDNHPDTIFKYPVFMRYANKLMEEGDDTLDNLSLDDSLRAIGTLVEKMIKWEFHAIHKTPAYFLDGEKKPEYQRFEELIYRMIDLILGDMINAHGINRAVGRDVVVSAFNLLFPNEENGQDNPLQAAHCLFSWDSEGKTFEFHNSLFWDYFASKYICESNVDYKVKKHMFNLKSENTRTYQSIITAYFKRLYSHLQEKAAEDLFSDAEKRKQISIDTISGVCLTEFYKKFPFDDWDFAHSSKSVFDSETIVDIIEKHMLILESGNALDINCASYIKELCTVEELISLTHIAFFGVGDDNFDISFLFDLPNLQYITLPPYHKAFLQLGAHNDLCERKLHLWHRTAYSKAESRLCDGRNTKDDIKLLEIIFSLEIQDTEYMGLDKPDYQSTCWTALSLAEAYRDKALYLTETEQHNVLRKIAETINSDWENKKLNYRYCYDYGRLNINSGKPKRDSGIKWLLVPYNSEEDEKFVKFTRFDLGCQLVKAYVWNLDIEKGISVLHDIESRYNVTKTGAEYNKVRCALYLCKLKKEYDSPIRLSIETALRALHDYSKSIDGANALYGRYASEFYMIIGDYRNAKLVIDELDDALSKTNMNGEDDEDYHGDWIKYHEMLLLYLYLTGDYKKAMQTADELLEYKYRTANLESRAYRHIKNKCEVALNPNIILDDTLFESYDCFRRKSIWI